MYFRLEASRTGGGGGEAGCRVVLEVDVGEDVELVEAGEVTFGDTGGPTTCWKPGPGGEYGGGASVRSGSETFQDTWYFWLEVEDEASGPRLS